MVIKEHDEMYDVAIGEFVRSDWLNKSDKPKVSFPIDISLTGMTYMTFTRTEHDDEVLWRRDE